ncbi:MAG: ATP-binding cassette domain-containing protein [Lachnospirales bacterium]
MIEVKDLVVEYSDFKLNCSIKVENNRITGLVGKNGAGKTTLFKSILGLCKIESGAIFVNNKEISKLTLKDKESIGVVLGDSFYSSHFTCKDICTISKNFYADFDEKYFLDNCKKLNIPLDKKLKDFSTGMLGKTKVLTATSHKASLLILDEPTSGLDVQARTEILDLLHDYMDINKDCSIVVSSHISSDLEKICDDIYFIDDGTIILHEDTDVLLDDYGIIKVRAKANDFDMSYLLYQKKTSYGYDIITNKKLFYTNKYPDLIVDKGTIDEILMIIMGGEKLC